MKLDLEKIRKTLHAKPELSGKEVITQGYIRSIIENDLGGSTRVVGRTGLLYESPSNSERTLLVRVDIDALPIIEENTFEWKSNHDGISHKCGHDGHTTIGLGLIEKLIQEPLQNISVSVLFQPAEENGEGAKEVIDDPNFSINAFNYVIALHNIPGIEFGKVIIKQGNFTPSVQSLVLKFNGVTSHAAEPKNGKNPSYVISNLITWMKETENDNSDSDDFNLITPIHVNIGEPNYGISPGYGELHLTLRSWTEIKMNEVTDKLLAKAHALASNSELDLLIEKLAVFAANNNNEFIVDCIRESTSKLNLQLGIKEKPFTWGEDFGLFTQRVSGAMFGLGAGIETPPLHNPTYDFPDQIIGAGVSVFYETAKTIANNAQ